MKWAVVVIDLQRDLCWAPRRKEVVQGVLPNVLKLINVFADRAAPIFYSRFELEPDDVQFKRFGDVYCVRGTPGCEFIDEILPLRGPVIKKTKHSVFFDTDLDSSLRALDVDGVVLAGLQTQICVLTSAADAYHRGYQVVVAADAVASTREEVRLEAVEWIDKYVGKSQSVAQIEQWL